MVNFLNNNKYINYLFIIAGIYFCILDHNKLTLSFDSFWHIKTGLLSLKFNKVIQHTIDGYFDPIPYVNHESLFQIIVAGIHSIFHIKGLLILVQALSAMMFVCFLNLSAPFSILFFISAIFSSFLTETAFILRPQIFTLVIFSFLPLLKDSKLNNKFKMSFLLFFSLFIANTHGGLLPIYFIFVFLLFDFKAYLYFFIFLISLLNPAGIDSHLYAFHAQSPQLAHIMEWKSIDYTKSPIAVFSLISMMVVIFVNKNFIFKRMLLILFVFLLVIHSYKTLIYGLVFIPYLLASCFEKVNTDKLKPKIIFAFLSLFFITNLTLLLKRYDINKKIFPVEEVVFLMNNHGLDLKIYNEYSVGGFLTYSGYKVLAYGIPEAFESKINNTNQTRMDASLNKIHTKDVLNIIKLIKPQIVLLPNWSEGIPFMTKEYGQPDYQGLYGPLWVLDSATGHQLKQL